MLMAEGGGQVVGRRSERARYDACELETQSSLGPSCESRRNSTPNASFHFDHHHLIIYATQENSMESDGLIITYSYLRQYAHVVQSTSTAAYSRYALLRLFVQNTPATCDERVREPTSRM